MPPPSPFDPRQGAPHSYTPAMLTWTRNAPYPTYRCRQPGSSLAWISRAHRQNLALAVPGLPPANPPNLRQSTVFVLTCISSGGGPSSAAPPPDDPGALFVIHAGRFDSPLPRPRPMLTSSAAISPPTAAAAAAAPLVAGPPAPPPLPAPTPPPFPPPLAPASCAFAAAS